MLTDELETFRRNLRRMRTERGMSMDALAAESGLSCRCIYRYENGDGGPNLKSAIMLAKVFGCTMTELVGV